MRRRFLMVVFAIGAIGGYASGFHHLRGCMMQRRAVYEAHVARVCVDAAAAKPATEVPGPRGPGP